MNAHLPASRRIIYALLALSAAAALPACSDGPAIVELERPAVCREPFLVDPSVTPLADSLLVIVEAPALSAEQQQRLAAARAVPTAARVLVARMAASPGPMLQPGHEFVLSVSPTRSFIVTGQQLTPGASAISYLGGITGNHGEVRLVLTGEGITATVQTMPGGGLAATPYFIQPLGGGLHAVTCIDPGKFPPD